MKAFSRFLFLSLISASASECALDGGACDASDLVDSISLLQVDVVLRSSPHRADTQVAQIDSQQSHLPPASIDEFKPLQNFHATAWDRYPAIFKGLQDLLHEGGATRLKLLSFGCSYGVEVHSLRKYFLDATIDGVDIASGIIAKNKASNIDPEIHFYDNVTNLPAQSYDAILAMGVLLHAGKDRTGHLDYSQYVQSLDLLDSLLRPGGYLVVYNADYPFSEYPRHYQYKNMCTQSFSDDLVPSADLKVPDPDLGQDLDPDALVHGLSVGASQERSLLRGMCSQSDEDDFCIESGWSWKINRAGTIVQHDVNPSSMTDEVSMSRGCKYAGPFFKKL